MTIATAARPSSPRADRPRPDSAADRRVPMTRLVRLELRKAIDTRASIWLLGVGALMIVGTLVVILVWDRETLESGFGALFGLSTSLLSMFLMILGALLGTSEWSQRTALTTFALEPRRGRIVAAKTGAALALGLTSGAVAVTASAAALLVGALLTGRAAVWSMSGGLVLGTVVLLLTYALQGVAFGFLTLNSPLAIGGLFVLPTVWTLASTLTSIGPKLPWLDLNLAASPIALGDLSAAHILTFAGAAGIWVLLPLALGVVRILRSEVK